MPGRATPGRRPSGRHRAPGRASWSRHTRPENRPRPLALLVAAVLTVGLGGGLGGSSAAIGAVAPGAAVPAAQLTPFGGIDAAAPAALAPATQRVVAAAQTAVAERDEARAVADAARIAAAASTAGRPADDPALAALTAAVARLDRAASPATHGPASDGRTDRQVTAELEDATAAVFAAAQQVWEGTEDAGALVGVRWSGSPTLTALEDQAARVAKAAPPVMRLDPPRGDHDVPGPDELCPVAFAPDTVLRCDAARALDSLNTAYRADHGADLVVTSGFRTFAEQVAVKAARGSLAATPGTSNHEVGIAVDLGGMGDVGEFDAPAYLWMKEHAGDYGWYHPPAMEPGGSGPEEPWHWEYRG